MLDAAFQVTLIPTVATGKFSIHPHITGTNVLINVDKTSMWERNYLQAFKKKTNYLPTTSS
jgi:hypothetical protein